MRIPKTQSPFCQLLTPISPEGQQWQSLRKLPPLCPYGNWKLKTGPSWPCRGGCPCWIWTLAFVKCWSLSGAEMEEPDGGAQPAAPARARGPLGITHNKAHHRSEKSSSWLNWHYTHIFSVNVRQPDLLTCLDSRRNKTFRRCICTVGISDHLPCAFRPVTGIAFSYGSFSTLVGAVPIVLVLEPNRLKAHSCLYFYKMLSVCLFAVDHVVIILLFSSPMAMSKTLF